MAELQIPAAAETALALGNSRHAIRLTVAAELRRLADEGMRTSDEEMARSNDRDIGRETVSLLVGRSLGAADVAHQLRDRAHELDGGPS